MNKGSIHCCIHFPGFSLQVATLLHPELVGKAFAWIHLTAGTVTSEQMSPAARRLRIPNQITLSELQKRWPQVGIIHAVPAAQQSLIERLLAITEAMTPQFRFERSSLHLDLTGIRPPPGSDWGTWATIFAASIERQCGLRTRRIAIAPTQASAELLAVAMRQAKPLVCPADMERAWLAKVPLRLVPALSPRIQARFQLYSLRTLGDLQRLDQRHVLKHFGVEGESLHARSLGFEPSPSKPSQLDMFGELKGEAGCASEPSSGTGPRQMPQAQRAS